VLLMASGDRLTAVNFVLLHDYLSSVVGSEMYVNWPLESLKAQAVAARSYALVHHVRNASRPYDLDNTQRYQAYLGIGKETNTTQTAVVATTGEFISHNGGIVESLYAASDEIVASAHNGNGMSQTGAMELANQGYTYTEILGNYYPGTSLSRLVVQ
jgi:peptidoglycan hydrolase-like amidase